MYHYSGKPESQPNVPRNHQSNHNTNSARAYWTPGPQPTPSTWQAPGDWQNGSQEFSLRLSQTRSSNTSYPLNPSQHHHWHSYTHHHRPDDWQFNSDRPRISAHARTGGSLQTRGEYTDSEEEDMFDVLSPYIFGIMCQRLMSKIPELWEELCRHRAAREALTTRPPPPPPYYGRPVIKRYTFGSISPQDQYRIDHMNTARNRIPPHQPESVKGNSGSGQGDDKPKSKVKTSGGDVNAVPYRVDRAPPQNRRIQAQRIRSYSNAPRY